MNPYALPERPPSEVEWEELLVKVDIAPRALRVAVEDAAEGPALRAAVTEALSHELHFARCLDDLRTGRPVSLFHFLGEVRVEGRVPTVEEALAWYTRTRERNFAQVQRRGLDVWDWRSAPADGESLTAYQLLQFMVRMDGRLLQAIRAAGRG